MRRIFIIVLIVILAVLGFFYYDHITTKRNEANREAFDVVMTEKMRELSEQAQDQSKPIQLDIHDPRLSGDYKVLSEFLLNYWIKNINTRNNYLNQLASAKWNHFLDVKRLDADRKQNYSETENMLVAVQHAMQSYQEQNKKNEDEALNQLKTLNLSDELKQPLREKLAQNAKIDPESDLILNELQILKKAQAMFEMLKKYPWTVNGDKILFQDDAQVKQFNQLFQDVLKLNVQIKDKKDQNAEVLEEAL